MKLDIRYPIGLLFLIIGGLLSAYGFLRPAAAPAVNINLWWGLIQVAFGAVMLALAARTGRSSGPG